jgi:hypothetical protein
MGRRRGTGSAQRQPLPCQVGASRSHAVSYEVRRHGGLLSSSLQHGSLLYFSAVPRRSPHDARPPHTEGGFLTDAEDGVGEDAARTAYARRIQG